MTFREVHAAMIETLNKAPVKFGLWVGMFGCAVDLFKVIVKALWRTLAD